MSLPTRERLFRRPSWTEAEFVANALRTETIGGALLLVAAVVALIWANSPFASAYESLRDFEIGPHFGHLDLSLGLWAADGLLAVFFLVAGLELKREFVVGELRNPRKAAVPVVAAICGVAVPAIVYALVVKFSGEQGLGAGWAIPTATDIAFALAVLAVISTHLPSALRSFLLTLAVVDDLIAITIIAIFYTQSFHVVPLLLALIPLAAFTWLVQHRIARLWLLAPLAFLTWWLVLNSGVHATVAGVLLGLAVPVKPLKVVSQASAMTAMRNVSTKTDLAHRFEHGLRPLSAGFCVPVFAFFAAGVAIVGPSATGSVSEALTSTVVIAIVLALIVGKFVGVLGGTWLAGRLTGAGTDDEVGWLDIIGLALLTGVGFTVSLLIGDLAFGAGSDHDTHVRIGVLSGSLLAAVLASAVLIPRNAHFRTMHERETLDEDGDGVPDVYEEDEQVDRV